MGWDEGILEQAVTTCTNPSGRIEDCPVFSLIDEAEAKECTFPQPISIKAESLLEGLLALPGDVPITYGDGTVEGGDEAEEPPKPSLTYQPGKTASETPLPGNVFKETTTTTSSPPPAPPPTTTSTSESSALTAPAVVNLAAVAPTTTSTSEPAPTTTPTPVVASVPVDPSEFVSTQYVTNGNLVSKILWMEEVVYETEVIDSTTTKTLYGGPPPSAAPETGESLRRRRAAAHLHGHGHHHF